MFALLVDTDESLITEDEDVEEFTSCWLRSQLTIIVTYCWKESCDNLAIASTDENGS